MGEMDGYAYTILVGKTNDSRLLWRHWSRWDNIKIDFKLVDWIEVTEDNVVINFRIP
jgi:hypothetical protein